MSDIAKDTTAATAITKADLRKVVKDLLMTAAVAGAGDEGWHADGIERLYFQHEKDIDRAGSVEIRHGKSNTGYVRLEAYLPPEVAAAIISLVVGSSAEEQEKFGRMSLPWREVVPSKAPANDIEEMTAEDTAVPKVVEISHAEARIAAEDDARKIELARLIKEQDEEERLAGMVVEENTDDEEEDDEIEPIMELDFER